MKNYLLLGIVSIAFVWLSLFLIKEYSEAEKRIDEDSFIDNFVPEVKITNLNDFLLETPDVIIIFADKNQEKDFIVEMVNLFAQQNILDKVIYIDRIVLTEKDQKKVKGLIDHEIEQNDYILFVHDFIVEDKYSLQDQDLDGLREFIEIKGYNID